MSSNDEYTYELINNDNDAHACARLMAEEFVVNEPLTSCEQISSQFYFDKFSWPAINNVMNEGLSFLVKHRPSGEIVGALLGRDLHLMREKHPYNASRPPSLTPVIDLIDEMNDIFVRRDFGHELKPNMVMCLRNYVIKAQHTGKGLASQLATVVCENARDTKGFQYALVQTSNPASRHIYLNKLHGKIVTEIDLTTWEWKNKNDESLHPYKNYKSIHVPNILVKLTNE
jgi:hypothetical protein